jgi:hypothetical protein
MTENKGIFVTEVAAGSPVAEADITEGMTILQINGKQIPTVHDFCSRLSRIGSGSAICLTLRASGGKLVYCTFPLSDTVSGRGERGLWARIPAWFLTFSALVYASGFLAVTTFLDRFGIRESGIGVWKAKYVYVGLLCVAPPLLIGGTLCGALRQALLDTPQPRLQLRLFQPPVFVGVDQPADPPLELGD